MNKPFTINLQINVYPDGTVSVNNGDSASGAGAAPASKSAAITVSSPALQSTPSDTAPPAPSTENSATGSGSVGTDSPTESDVRAALLAAVKASDKATAVGVLEAIAGVSRVPDVPADKRAAVVEALNKIIASAANESRGGA